MSGNTISILEGNTFVVSDRREDIDASNLWNQKQHRHGRHLCCLRPYV